MDPFEEFEFKPLTDGLGFHKKKSQANNLESSAPEKELSSSIIPNKGLDLLEETSTDPLRSPLPRKSRTTLPEAPGGLTEVGGDSAPSAAVDEILKTLQKNRRIDFENTKTKQRITANTKEEFKKTTFSFSAALLDGMLVVAASLLCMIILLVITKVDLIGNLTNPDSQGMIYLSTLSLFAGVSFIYLTVNRVFMGCTPGEWAFDQRIGKPEELNKAVYSLQVFGRSILVIVTGFIVMPLLSLAFNKDFAGSVTGAQLYKKG